MESIGLGPALPFELPLLGRAVVGQQLESRAPLLALHLPVQHHRGGNHNQVWPPDTPAHAFLSVLQSSQARIYMRTLNFGHDQHG